MCIITLRHGLLVNALLETIGQMSVVNILEYCSCRY